MIPQTLGSKPQSHDLKTQLSSDYQMNDFRPTTKEFLLLGSPLLLKTLSCRFLILVKPGFGKSKARRFLPTNLVASQDSGSVDRFGVTVCQQLTAVEFSLQHIHRICSNHRLELQSCRYMTFFVVTTGGTLPYAVGCSSTIFNFISSFHQIIGRMLNVVNVSLCDCSFMSNLQ